MAAQSRLREVARQLALELRKVMGDHGDSQNAADSTPWVRDQAGIGTPPRCNVPACVCLPSDARKCLSPSSHDDESFPPPTRTMTSNSSGSPSRVRLTSIMRQRSDTSGLVLANSIYPQ